MTSQLRSDEKFVARSLADHFMGTWRDGEDPPDAYLQIGNEVAAVEISTLTQHVRDERGDLKPRLSEDSSAIWLANELNKELKATIPNELLVMLTLSSPILKARKVKVLLKEKIAQLVSSVCRSEITEDILGNRMNIHIVTDDRPSGKKVVGIVTNANSSTDILKNAWEILEDRIIVKADKCCSLAFIGPKWLALLNDYWLADNETYQQAIELFSVDHPFEKILLVSGNGSVAVLYEIQGVQQRP